MFDAHNHLQRFAQPERIIAEMKSVGITGCVVNGTSETDWRDVAALAEAHPDFIRPAFGLHPWFAHERSPAWMDTLQSLLDQFPQASIGECGLDRWVAQPSIDEQLEVFLPQIKLSHERELPITLHALKAWGPLLEALNEHPQLPRGFLLHSFGGSRELVTQLVPLGARFSFSGYFLHPKKAKIIDAYQAVPHERLLLETDAPEMLPPEGYITHPLEGDQNHPANLPVIAESFANALARDPKELVTTCNQNAAAFFNP